MEKFRTTKIAEKFFGMGYVSKVYLKNFSNALLSKFNYYSFGFLAMLISLFVISCKDNPVLDNMPDDQTITVDIAKKWFDKNVSNSSNISTVNSNNHFKIAYWKKATEKIDSKTGEHYVEVPIFEVSSPNVKDADLDRVANEVQNKIDFSNSWTNLKVFRGVNRLIEYELITTIPIVENYKSNPLQKFIGYRIIKDWKDNILRGYVVNNDIETSLSFTSKQVKSAKVLLLCHVDYYSFVVTTDGGGATITRYTNTVYFECGGNDTGGGGYITPASGLPSGGGGGSGPVNQNLLDNAHTISDAMGLSEIEDVIGKEPTVNLPILNPCQQDAHIEYLRTAAGLENDYEIAKNDCLNNFVGAGLGADAFAVASGQLSLKSFATWWGSTGKFTTYRPGAANGFVLVMSGSFLAARQCVENKLKDTNYKILAARKLFDKKYLGDCR